MSGSTGNGSFKAARTLRAALPMLVLAWLCPLGAKAQQNTAPAAVPDLYGASDPAGTSVQDPDPIDPSAPSPTGIRQGDNQIRTQSGTHPDIAAPDLDSNESLLDQDIRRLNTRETRLDEEVRSRRERPDIATEEAPGIRISSFVLRPTVTQSINTETTKDDTGRQTRGFLQTDMKTTLTSDWSLHQLTVTSEGTWQKNISGQGEEQPSFRIDSDLRLDLTDRTTANITGGYRFYREDTDDPNAVAGASTQSDVQELTAGLSLTHQVGRIRGTIGLDVDRLTYSDVKLTDGSKLSLADRNETTGTVRARLGYELSPALIPFIEASVGQSVYDERLDSAGYRRSGNEYGLKAGAEIDLSEKLRGEASIGYQTAVFDDARLADIGAVAVDAGLTWSPLRGTDVAFAAQTQIQPSTTPGEGGYVSHGLSTTISHRILDNLTGTVIGGIVFRDYADSQSDQMVYSTGAGLIWNINRYLDFTSTLGYEITDSKSGSDTQQWRAGVGLRLKR